MEKRTLLAFGLSLAVFILWSMFMTAMNPPKKNKKIQPSDQVVQTVPGQPGVVQPGVSGEASITTPPPPMSPQEIIEAKFPGTEQLITIETDKATYVLSNRGAVIKEITVKKYKDDEGNSINLINHENGSKYPLTILADDIGVSQILENSYFEADGESFLLDQSHPNQKIVLSLKHESGIEVYREFSFNFDQYMFNVETRITAHPLANQNLQYTMIWGPGLGGEVESKTDYFTFSGPTTFINNERVETPADEVDELFRHKGALTWTAFQNKYFAAVMIPEDGVKSAVVLNKGDGLYVGLEFQSVQSASTAVNKVYVGTKELSLLEAAENKLVRVIDYGWFGNKFAFLVKPILKGLNYFYGMTGNYGWAIIILTFLIKLIFFPLSHKSFKSMKGMQKIQPYVKVIQERNKDDRQKMNTELLDLYKKHKVNPLGGCLPMLLQIPVFIALYHALFFSIELRGAPFMLWIQDLSVSDPYYVTPILMGATMFLQQRMTPMVGDPIQQKIMMFLPIVFTFLFLSFPAGLVIYWTVNNILTISQQFYIYKIAKD
ncbi:MAG: membrane protein insertase YidC [Nitrospinales bacterium]